jgi:hypothetical protein
MRRSRLLFALIAALGGVGAGTILNAEASSVGRLRTWTAAGGGGIAGSDVAAWTAPKAFVTTDGWSNGGTSIATSAGTVWLESISFDVPHSCTGVTYGMGGTVGGQVQFTVYGSGTSGGRIQPVTTPGTADGAILVAQTAATAQAGTVSRGQTISFSSGPIVFNRGSFYIGSEFLDANGTYVREAQASVGIGLRKTVGGHTWGTPIATISGSAESVNSFPSLTLLCSPTPVSYP